MHFIDFILVFLCALRVLCGQTNRKTILVLLSIIFLSASGRSVFGVEDQRAFLHALQDQGYGQLAVDYLTSLRDRGLLNDALRDAFDAELAGSLCVAARETRDPAEALRKFAEAESLLGAFLRRNPTGITAARALLNCGDIELSRAELMIGAPGGPAGRDSSDAAWRDARAALERARSYFSQALAICEQSAPQAPGQSPGSVPWEVTKSPPLPEDQAVKIAQEQKEAEEAALDCRFKLAMVDYTLAQTYPQQDDPNRIQALESAAQALDAIFQRNRMRRPGLYAHFWHGKVLDALGDRRTALDVFDEVLAGAPGEGRPRPEPALESLYAEAEYCRLRLLAKADRWEDIAREAGEWLRANAPARQTDGYQGVRLEQAKALLHRAAKKNDRQARQEGFRALAEVVKVPGVHQQEAILLRHRYAKDAGDIVLNSFTDAMALGNASAAGGLWEDAVAAYARAVELGKNSPPSDEFLTAEYRLALAEFYSGHREEALALAEKLAQSHPQHPLAPVAAALAVRAAAALAADAKDKTGPQQRLEQLADFTARQWPDRPEADEARLLQGQTALAKGDYDAAMSIFDSLPPSSPHYVMARYLAAQTSWQRYLEEKRKPDAPSDPEALAAGRLQTLKILTSALERLPAPAAGVEAQGDTILRMRILLAEVHLEGGNPGESLKLLSPLQEKADDRSMISAETASILLCDLVKAHLAAKDPGGAAKAALRLADIGEDTPPINAVLAEMLRRISPAAKPAEAPEMKQFAESLLKRLAARRNFTLSTEAILADACRESGQNAAAQAYYQDIVKKAESDPSLRQAHPSAVSRARSQLIGTLRAEKKYAEALQEANRLVAENPRSLEPLLEKGRILQDWAETDPKHYGDALAVWTPLRIAMMRLPRKPPEYYEVVYNAAYCLMAQFAVSHDNTQLAEARQLLKTALVLNPQLNGPEMVAKYKTLLEKCRFLREHQL